MSCHKTVSLQEYYDDYYDDEVDGEPYSDEEQDEYWCDCVECDASCPCWCHLPVPVLWRLRPVIYRDDRHDYQYVDAQGRPLASPRDAGPPLATQSAG